MVTWREVPVTPGEALSWRCESDAELRRALITENSAALGRWGEEAAAALAQSRGARVMHRNFRIGRLETDLVLRRGDLLAFTEVRTRRFNSLQGAEHTLGRLKLERLMRGACAAVEALGWEGAWRIDFVALDVCKAFAVAHWYEGIEEGDL